MRDLLVGFVREDWVRRIDFETLERVDGSFVTDDLRGRENDVIWRVRFEDRWLYVYLLLDEKRLSSLDPSLRNLAGALFDFERAKRYSRTDPGVACVHDTRPKPESASTSSTYHSSPPGPPGPLSTNPRR